MKVKVKIFGSLSELFGCSEKEIELSSGANVQDLFGLLCLSERYRQAIYDDSGLLRYYVNIMVKSGKDAQLLGDTDRVLPNRDYVTIFTAVGGG
jgi:molybdopterin converting factor small subunit